MKDFIQGKAYPREEENLVSINTGDIIDKDKVYFALLIDNESSFIDRTEALLKLSTLMTQQVSLHKKDYENNRTDQGIDLRFAELLRTVSNFTGYLIGCSSWREGKIQNYDQGELIKRLNNIILMVKNG